MALLPGEVGPKIKLSDAVMHSQAASLIGPSNPLGVAQPYALSANVMR